MLCSEIAEAYPEILEMDLNPVIVHEEGLSIVDARVILKSDERCLKARGPMPDNGGQRTDVRRQMTEVGRQKTEVFRIRNSECGLRPVGATGAYTPEGSGKIKRRLNSEGGRWKKSRSY